MTTRLATTCISGPRIRAGGVANMSSPAGPILIRSGPRRPQRNGKTPESSSFGRLPTTSNNYSRNLRSLPTKSLRSLLLRSLGNLRSRSLCSLELRSLCSLCSRNLCSRLQVVRLGRTEMFRWFPCRRHRTCARLTSEISSSSSVMTGRSSVSRGGTFAVGTVADAPPPSPKTPRQRLVPGRPSSDASALKFASRAPC